MSIQQMQEMIANSIKTQYVDLLKFSLCIPNFILIKLMSKCIVINFT